ncbi:MAG TPA: type II secretion system protein GspJ [Spirochaetota bacterium]|nr:type II secretion system protein GspJ [Spirochaetota bacterium]HOR43641.1 type II secretion system protein GspJ [Spirochaetota bacterium]HOU83518.1 type II secretion system protein GspJ [Spirochaetota bacterium]HPK55074.1 type II secretion system protein GspJ [Spirochaetota bacterium]HQA53858.1 type II secretion system protein GspJ [Spirochaetota bacterium]
MKKYDDGFSLLEMIIALALSSIVLMMIYAAERTIIRAVSQGKKESERIYLLSNRIRTIQSDFSSIFLYEEPAKYPVSSETKISGEDYLISFFSIKSAAVFPVTNYTESDHSCDIVNVLYKVREENGIKKLYRIEKEITDSENQIKTECVLFENVSEAKAEFYAGRSWNKKWNSADNFKYPEAVRLIVVYKEKGKDEQITINGFPGMMGK